MINNRPNLSVFPANIANQFRWMGAAFCAVSSDETSPNVSIWSDTLITLLRLLQMLAIHTVTGCLRIRRPKGWAKAKTLNARQCYAQKTVTDGSGTLPLPYFRSTPSVHRWARESTPTLERMAHKYYWAVIFETVPTPNNQG